MSRVYLHNNVRDRRGITRIFGSDRWTVYFWLTRSVVWI